MRLEESLTYSDVLIKPNFSTIRSRNEVSLEHTFCDMSLGLPIIGSNMDSVMGEKMSAALSFKGAVGALHRFQSIDENVEQFYRSIDLAVNSLDSSKYNKKPIISVGIGDTEYNRALTLFEAGAEVILIDVAHGAGIHVVEQYDRIRAKVGKNAAIIVGNFDNYESINAFLSHIKSGQRPDALKIGVGNGAACTTRVVTGCGGGMISALLSCSQSNIPLIADGGAKNSGDIAKALACGASSVMVGSMLAGTDQSPGELIYEQTYEEDRWGVNKKINKPLGKKYRGSASLESYEIQGKVSEHRTPEGESMVLDYKGSVYPILDSLSAGLKSSLSYTGSRTLEEFKKNAQIVKVSQSTFEENKAHGKK
jgi:IMP dehydrogenase